LLHEPKSMRHCVEISALLTSRWSSQLNLLRVRKARSRMAAELETTLALAYVAVSRGRYPVPCSSNICSYPGSLCSRGGRFLSGVRRKLDAVNVHSVRKSVPPVIGNDGNENPSTVECSDRCRDGGRPGPRSTCARYSCVRGLAQFMNRPHLFPVFAGRRPEQALVLAAELGGTFISNGKSHGGDILRTRQEP